MNVDAIFNGLPEESIEIDYGAICALTASWEIIMSNLDLDSEHLRKSFMPLTRQAILNRNISTISDIIDNSLETLFSISKKLSYNTSFQIEMDKQIRSSFDDIPLEKKEAFKITNSNSTIDKNLIKKIWSLKKEEFFFFFEIISSLSSTELSLSSVLKDKSLIIKDSFIQSDKIPSIRAIIGEIDDNTLKLTIKDLLVNSSSYISSSCKSSLYNYLDKISKNDNDTLKVLEDEKNIIKTVFLFKELYNFIKNYADDSIKNIFKEKYSSYNSDNNQSFNILYLWLDNISNKKKISVDSLLGDSSFSNYFNEEFSAFHKFLTLMNTLSFLNEKDASLAVKNIVGK